MFGEHVYRPFAAASHVRFGWSPVVVEGPFDDRVDAALQLVRGRRQPAAVLDDAGVAERERHPVPVQPDEPEAGPARPLVRPPPLAAPRMNRIVLGLGTLLEIIAVLAMPPVEVGEPCGRLCLSSNKSACRVTG